MTSSEKSTLEPDSSSSTTTATRPTTTAPPLRVRRPTPTPQPRPLTPSTSDLGGPSVSVSDPIPEGLTDTRSTAAIDPPVNVKLSKTSLAEVTRKAVFVASQYVHTLLARTPEEQAEDVWIAVEREQADIGDPVAGVIARHAGAAEVAADLADLIVAGVGLLAYVANHAARAWSIRQARRKFRAANPQPLRSDTGEPA